MASRAELERDIRNVDSLISAAEQAAAALRNKARDATSESAREKLNADAARKDDEVSKLTARRSGLNSHLRSL